MFITFEGIDGIGKTTIIEKVFDCLYNKHQISVIKTREPGGCKASEKIRKLIYHEGNSLKTWTKTLLFLAARYEHFFRVIKPALENKKVVLCDRYCDSTEAYQGCFKKNTNFSHLLKILQFQFLNLFQPDMTFLFVADLKIAKERFNARTINKKQKQDRFNFLLMEKINRTYLEIAQKNKKRICIIDASQDVEAVASEVSGKILKKINNFL